MANLFSYAPVNSLRLVYITTANLLYQSVPFDLNTPPQCYFQKRQTDDVETVQCLSDFVPSMVIYDLHSNLPIITITPTIPASNIVNQTFAVYEFQIVYAGISAGDYYALLTYTDQNNVKQYYQSEPINVKVNQPNTILFQYTNSENDFSTVFETGIQMAMRVEGCVERFRPAFVDVSYNDQEQNATLLNSVPYREFTLQIGNAGGVPDYIADIVNRIMSCDQKQIDGTYYEKTNGEKWDQKRAEPGDQNAQTFSGYSLSITYVENTFTEALQIGDTPAGNYIPVQKELNFFNQAADLPIPNVFKKYSLLEKIVIYRTGAVFTLKVGLSVGGDEIGTWSITELITALHIDYAFPDIATVYFSGIGGITIADFLIVYKQLDAAAITIGSPNPYQTLGVGAKVIYEAPTGQALAVDFNLGTGLGNVETDWYGWAICDGRNGTSDMGGVWPVGYVANTATPGDPPNTPYSVPDTIVTTNGVVLTEQNIPKIHLSVGGRGNVDSNQNGGAYGNNSPNTQTTLLDFGEVNPVAIPIVPDYIVSLWVKKIANNG